MNGGLNFRWILFILNRRNVFKKSPQQHNVLCKKTEITSPIYNVNRYLKRGKNKQTPKNLRNQLP